MLSVDVGDGDSLTDDTPVRTVDAVVRDFSPGLDEDDENEHFTPFQLHTASH